MGSRWPNTPRDPEQEAAERARFEREQIKSNDDYFLNGETSDNLPSSTPPPQNNRTLNEAAGLAKEVMGAPAQLYQKYFGEQKASDPGAELESMQAEDQAYQKRLSERQPPVYQERAGRSPEWDQQIRAKNAQVGRELDSGRGWHPPLRPELQGALGSERSLQEMEKRKKIQEYLRQKMGAPKAQGQMMMHAKPLLNAEPVSGNEPSSPAMAGQGKPSRQISPYVKNPNWPPVPPKTSVPADGMLPPIQGFDRASQAENTASGARTLVPPPKPPRPAQAPAQQNMDFSDGDEIGAIGPSEPEGEEFEIGDPRVNMGVSSVKQIPPQAEEEPWTPYQPPAQATETPRKEDRDPYRDYMIDDARDQGGVDLLPFMDVLNRSAAQAGTINGKAADTSSFSDMAKTLGAKNQKDQDNRSKIYQYLAQRQDKKKDDSARLQFERERLKVQDDWARARHKLMASGQETQLAKLDMQYAQVLATLGMSAEKMKTTGKLGEDRLTLDREKLDWDKSPENPKNKPGGKNGPKKITSTAIKSKRFGDMANESAKDFDKLVGSGHDPTDKSDYYLGDLPLVGNYLNSDKGKLQKQYELQFMRAVLRDESGALIGKDEYSEDRKKYFPRPGDTPAVIAAKKKARDETIKGLYLDYESQGGADESTPNEVDQSKPQTIIQGGHTYTLNPETGEYE